MGMRYNGLIVYSILTLNETIGSSREDIWKAVRGACLVGYYKHFAVCLKKMRDAGQIALKTGKFRLLMGFKLEILMALEKGKSGKKVATSSLSLKPGANKTAAKTQKGKGAAGKPAKGGIQSKR